MLVTNQILQIYIINTYVMFRAIWNHFYSLKNVRNTHRGVLLLVKLQASACNFTKSNTPPWVFFTFFKLYKWHQIAQRITVNFDHRLTPVKNINDIFFY